MECDRTFNLTAIISTTLKKQFLITAFIFCSTIASAQTNSNSLRDSLRKVFYGNYSYTHSYGFENIDMGNGMSMEVIPLSDEVTYYELELYRFGSFSREVNSSNPESMTQYFHNIEFGTWRIEADTLFLKVTDRVYDFYFIVFFPYSGFDGNYSTPVENPVEEKMYLIQGTYFCNRLDQSLYRDYNICYSKKER